ncbi:contractile injection system protein, VgrG/Pvc8 family [Actinoplanes sp. NPDC048796]|uniref:phage late control D family protein n=1 Tax=unclassified Actinoplanes TaxID=2626549 RepID=UPI0033E890D9
MDLVALEERHGGFYVPTFTVKVGGEDMLRDLFLAVSSVSVDLKERKAGHFAFTVVNAFDWSTGQFAATRRRERVDLLELFAFGSTVEIALGYGDPSKLTPMLTGVITEITTDFGAGAAPELSISGYDDLYPLTVGKRSQHWENEPDSTAVRDIVAALPGVDADVRVTSPVKARVDQNNETDLAFIDKLAERNPSVTFYERDRTLYFGPRRHDTTQGVELAWGRGLLSFRPAVNLARQISEVRVHGWSVADGRVITGRARRGDESGRDTRGRSGADRVFTALAADKVLNVRAAVRDQAEADARARAILDERARQFVEGEGESIGLPELRPDTNVTITGLGPAFSKPYYVSEATHRIDGGGYRTSFTIEEPTL